MNNNMACYCDAIKHIAAENAMIAEYYESPILSDESLSNLTYWKHTKISGMVEIVAEIFGKTESQVEYDIQRYRPDEVA